MDRELEVTLKALKNKTGIVADVYSSSFVYLFSSGEKINFVYNGTYTDGLQDKKQNITIFKFRFKRENYYGVINGASEIERNYALFISSYLENSGFTDDSLTKPDFVKGVMLGEITGNAVLSYERKFAIPKTSCYVLLIKINDKKIKEVIDFLDSYKINTSDTAVEISGDCCAFLKFLTRGSDAEYQSSMEFAEILNRSLYEETGISSKIGLGATVRSLIESVQSYAQAESALKLSEIFNSKSDVHSYKEYTLYKMLEDLPPSTLISYYNTLVDGDAKTILADSDMLETVEEFMENNLNVSETARKLYMHRNTLTYRLDKVQRATGLDIRNFSDAVTFRLCNLLHKILNK